MLGRMMLRYRRSPGTCGARGAAISAPVRYPIGSSGATACRGRGDEPDCEQLRPLQLLASSRHGANEELLVLGHGFSRRLLVGVVRRRLTAAEREVVKAGGKAIEVSLIRIAKACRQAIED